jgi:hypothetical protein
MISIFPFRSRVSYTEAFEGLELGEGKLSRPVLRGPGDRKAAWLLGHMEFAPNGCRSIGREHQLSGLTTHGRASETPLVCRRPKETRGVTRVLRAPSFNMIHRERAATVPLAERVYANTLSHHSAVGIVEHSVRRERSTTFARLFRQ